VNMNFSVERVRVGLLAGAGLLVVVIAAFLGYAHYRAHRFLTGLPGKLGMDIRQETNGFTYSQSVKGKTIYTIHAAKAVQRKDGKVTLDDVGIVLYGRGDGVSDRVDRIYGSEFEYDQNAGVVKAMGVVHIDLQAPAPADANAKANYVAGHDTKGEVKDERLIHVKTSGLVFLQKLGVAATDQDLEFEFNGMTGHARGADYNSDTGLLVLQSAVKVNGLKQGEPVVLTAGRAELDRQKQKTVLTRAVYTILGGEAGVRVAKADKVTAYMRRDGSVERAEAEGDVSLTDGTGSKVTAARGEVHLSETNQPEAATFGGGVRYASDEPLRQTKGEAAEGRGSFDKAGLLEHLLLNGAVHLHERTRPDVSGSTAWSERDVVSKNLELAMASDGGKRSRIELRQAKASGDARLIVMNPGSGGAKSSKAGSTTGTTMTTSTLFGDLLTADFVTRDGAAHLNAVHGTGHTRVLRVNDAGAKATSSGDVLEAEFGGGAKRMVAAVVGKAGVLGQGADEIVTAVQQGHVVLTNLAVPKAAGTSVPSVSTEQRATADRAVYDGATEQMTLTGTVQVSDAGNTVWADRMVMQQQTGDAVAEGGVRASYLQLGQQAGEAVHVLASHAELKHDAGRAIFYGAAGHPARLWQGASQVTAPVLQFEQTERRMVARADAQDKGMVVHAVFVSATPTNTTGAGAAKLAEGRKPTPVRISSREMTYSDPGRRADFSGGVLVENIDGTMRAQQGVVYLQAATSKAGDASVNAPAKKAQAQGAFLGGSVERMIASGRVDIVQPGRHATGEQVVYTASDGVFVMTGVPGTLPKMLDEARGTITGASLRFHAGDNSVVVSNGPDSVAGSHGVAGQRVRTETRVKQ
jgi:lipopolysaccharide export system protein LptA